MGNQTWTIKRHSQHPSQYTEGRQIKTNYTKQKIKTMSNTTPPKFGGELMYWEKLVSDKTPMCYSLLSPINFGDRRIEERKNVQGKRCIIIY